MKVVFFLRPKSAYLQARISFGGNRPQARLSTGIRMRSGLVFDEVEQSFVGRSATALQLNGQLSRIRAALKDASQFLAVGHIADMIHLITGQKEPVPTVDATGRLWITAYLTIHIERIDSGVVKSARNKRYAKNSVVTYRTLAAILTRYKEDRGADLDLFKCDLNNRPNLEEKRKAAGVLNKYLAGLHDYMVEHDYSINTQEFAIRMCKILINAASAEYFMNIPVKYTIATEDAPIVVLPPDVVASVLQDKAGVYDTLCDRMRMVYEVACTILVTTFRISDAISLAPIHLSKDGSGRHFIQKHNIKTGAMTLLPIPDRLAAVYGANIKRNGTLFTCEVNERTARSFMPELFKLWPETHRTISVPRKAANGEEYYFVTSPLYDFCKPHVLRKSAITSMLVHKVPERDIKQMSGHTANSSAFERYAGFAEKVFNSNIEDYYAKMFTPASA